MGVLVQCEVIAVTMTTGTGGGGRAVEAGELELCLRPGESVLTTSVSIPALNSIILGTW